MKPLDSTKISQAWLESLRPRTLPLTLSSIITGSALAAWLHYFHWNIAIMSLITAGLLQILSNLANDYGDAIKGSDTEERIGPKRGIQNGVITLQQLKQALWIVIIATILSGGILIFLACHNVYDVISFLFLGLCAIIAAITYTVGNKPYGYIGLGDLSVLIFFGWLGVGGTFYLQAQYFTWSFFLPATACGLLAASVLNINNLRDINNDRLHGKNTLAVRLGPVWGRRYHAWLIIVALLCLSIFSLIYIRQWTGWLFLLATPLLYKQTKYIMQHPTAEEMKPMLEQIVKGVLLTNLLFAIGIALSL